MVHPRPQRRRRRLHGYVPRGRRCAEHPARSVGQRGRSRHARLGDRHARPAASALGLGSDDVHRSREAARARRHRHARRRSRGHPLAQRRPDLSAEQLSEVRVSTSGSDTPIADRPSRVAMDVNTLIGPYPFRYVPHPDPDILVRVLDREQIAGAWVGHLPSAFYRDPLLGNIELAKALAPFADRLRPVPTIRPDWPKWTRLGDDAVAMGAPAIRVYPPQWGMGPHD